MRMDYTRIGFRPDTPNFLFLTSCLCPAPELSVEHRWSPHPASRLLLSAGNYMALPHISHPPQQRTLRQAAPPQERR